MKRLLLALFLVAVCLTADDTKPATPKKDSHEAILIGNATTVPSFKGIVILTSTDIPDIAYEAYYCGQLDGVIAALRVVGGFEDRLKQAQEARDRSHCDLIDELRKAAEKGDKQ